jgi:uncharacterized protein (TIGR02118 family)
MIKVTVLYENAPGKRFDFAYYLGKHIPMVKQKFGAACKRIEVDQGLAGAQPGSKAPFVAVCHLLFDSADAFQNAFAPVADSIMGDIPNYTDIQPVIQLNEVKL